MKHRPITAADGDAESQRRLDAAVFGLWQSRAKVRALGVASLGFLLLLVSQIVWAQAPDERGLMEGLRMAGTAATLAGLAIWLFLGWVRRLPPWVDPRKLLAR